MVYAGLLRRVDNRERHVRRDFAGTTGPPRARPVSAGPQARATIPPPLTPLTSTRNRMAPSLSLEKMYMLPAKNEKERSVC